MTSEKLQRKKRINYKLIRKSESVVAMKNFSIKAFGSLDKAKKALMEAKKLFFCGMGLREISEATGIPYELLRLKAAEKQGRYSWTKERSAVEEGIMKNAIRSLKKHTDILKDILDLNSQALKDYLIDLNSKIAEAKSNRVNITEIISIKEAKMLSELHANIHHVESLELNKPTEIIVEQGLTYAHITAMIAEAAKELEDQDPGMVYAIDRQQIEETGMPERHIEGGELRRADFLRLTSGKDESDSD